MDTTILHAHQVDSAHQRRLKDLIKRQRLADGGGNGILGCQFAIAARQFLFHQLAFCDLRFELCIGAADLTCARFDHLF